MNNELATSKKAKSCWPVLKDNEFWDEFFFRIGNGESLRGVSKDLGIPFQTVWSAIMIDEARKASYEDARMSRALTNMLQRSSRFLKNLSLVELNHRLLGCL